jgi:glycosyltransferase involved in cell wall biosynthesis
LGYCEVKEIKEKFNFNGKMILYIGLIRPHKNLLRVLEALRLLISEGEKDYFLVLVGGEKNDYIFLKKTAFKLGISKHVFFTGRLPDTEVVALMNAADVFVFPSLEEGFGLPPLEAMACGTPVVTSELSSLPEVVGDAALLVDPKNVEEIASAIKQVLVDHTLRESLITKGLERVKKFSWKKTAMETLKIYQQAYQA